MHANHWKTIQSGEEMFADVRELNQHFIDLWWEGSTGFPDLGPQYTAQARTQNEKGLLQILDQLDHTLANPPRNREEAQATRLRLAAAFRCIAEDALGFDGVLLDRLPSQAFSDVMEEFVHKARLLDTRLSAENIYQAGRNAWTAHALQWLLNLPVEL